MKDGNRAKFTQNAELRALLLATRGTTLVEASPYDRIWGIGLAATDPRAHDPKTWRGQNLLGKILTELRDELERSVGSSGLVVQPRVLEQQVRDRARRARRCPPGLARRQLEVAVLPVEHLEHQTVRASASTSDDRARTIRPSTKSIHATS